jgi:hypothetical protein
LGDILHEFCDLRSAAAELKAATSRAVNVYWLANHTQGANWDTVAQLVHREKVDAYMSAVTDGYTPLSSWEERVKTAMKEARQEQHLAKDGSALGPLCPELLKRFGRAGGDSQYRQGNRDGSSGGRGRGSRHPYKGRPFSCGKENRRSGGAATHGGGDGKGRARPAAAAPGAAAAAAAGAAAGGGAGG